VSAKHTPGPWIVKENRAYKTSWLIYDQEGNQLAQVANWQDKTFNCDAEINANLIAAAPDLLEALLEAEAGLEFAGADKEPEGQFVPAPTLALRIVRAAIAKAKGEVQ
jgi:hypothetical protein